MKQVFRAKMVDSLRKAFRDGRLTFHGQLKPLGRVKVFADLLRQTFGKDWVVYCKRPFGGAGQVLRYLGCYTHRVAISNHRLLQLNGAEVIFRWRDSAHQNKKRRMSLPVNEFLRRFLLHVLPRGFVRIRHFGFLSTRHRSESVPLCRELIAAEPQKLPRVKKREPDVRWEGLWRCPNCGGPMLVIERLSAIELRLRSPPVVTEVNAT